MVVKLTADETPVSIKLKVGTWIKVVGSVLAVVATVLFGYFQLSADVASATSRNMLQDKQLEAISECQKSVDRSLTEINTRLSTIDSNVSRLTAMHMKSR
jgi:hypothetical protein